MTEQAKPAIAEDVAKFKVERERAQDRRARRKAIKAVGGIRQYKKLLRLALSEL